MPVSRLRAASPPLRSVARRRFVNALSGASVGACAGAPTLRMLAAAALALGGRAFGADLASTIAAARPSVVPVGTYSPTDSPRFGFRGSGFAVGDGLFIVTNYHVMPPAGDGEARGLAVLAQAAAPGREAGDLRQARLVASNRAHDLAILRIEGRPLPTLTLAEGTAREGQSVALMGFPIGGALGYSTVTHRGIVASITTAALPAPTAAQLDPRAVARLRQDNFEVLQLDATAYPGNSGGPLVDAETGRVVGIVNMVLVKGSRETALSAPTGITYAIPVRYLRDLLDDTQRPPR